MVKRPGPTGETTARPPELSNKKILGVFRTAPIRPMKIEAALVPPRIWLNTNIQNYAIRALKLAPTHLINLELAPSTLYLDLEPSLLP